MSAPSRLTIKQRQEFFGSDFDNPIPSKKVKDSITPILKHIVEMDTSDEDEPPRVFVALAKPLIGILEYQSDYEGCPEATFAQPASINDIRQNWGSVSATIRVDIPLLINVTNTKKVLFYRASDIDMKIDDWMTGYLKDRYSKSVLISTANRVKSISRRVTDIDQDLSEIKTMLQQMGGKSPALKVSSIGSPEELFKILSISPAPDNSHCIVKLKCGFSFRMNQQALDRWLLCSQLQPLNDICYPSPESLSIDNVTKIMSSLYYVDDSKLREFIDSNPAIESLIVD